MAIKHSFVSAKADGTDATQIQPSNWNSAHQIDTPSALSGGTGVLLGTDASNLLTLDGIKSSAALQYLRRNAANAVYEFANFPFLVSTDFDFTLRAPVESLSPSSRSFTLATVPVGVNGTDTLHYLGIFNNAGVFQEAVLITGGTAVSGAASGTIIVSSISGTYATGAYKIGSVTAGVNEATISVVVANGLSAGPSVFIPQGTHKLYATCSIQNYPSIRGAGSNSTVILKCFASGDLFYFGDSTTTLSGIAGGLSDLQIRILPGVTDSTGWAIHVKFRYNVTVQNMTIYGDPNVGIGQIKNGVYFDNCLTCNIYNCKILNILGVGLQLGSTPPDQITMRIVGVDVTSTTTTNTLVYMFGNVLSLYIDGLQMQGGDTNWEINTNSGAFTESCIDNIVFDSAASKAFNLHGTGNTFKIMFSNIELGTLSSATASIGMIFDGTGAGIFQDFTLANVIGGAGALALYILGTVLNFLVDNSRLMCNYTTAGVNAVQVQGTATNVKFSNCVMSNVDRGFYIPSGTHVGITLVGCNIYGVTVGLSVAGAHTNLLIAACVFTSAGTPSSFTGSGTKLFRSNIGLADS